MGGGPAEQGDTEHLRAGLQVRDALAHRGDGAGELEAGRDGPADELLGRGIQPHADDAVRVVDADGLGGHQHLAGLRYGYGQRFSGEPLVTSRTMDDYLS